MTEKVTAEELLGRLAENDLSEEDLATYFIDSDAAGPFSPVLAFNPETVILPDGDDAAMRSALALNLVNAGARHERRIEFNKRIAKDPHQLRIAAEGDSWFQYPLILKDVIDHVMKRYAVLCTSAAGDLLAEMLSQRDYITSLRESGAKILLLSAGGNDVLAGGALAKHLETFQPGLQPADYLRPSYDVLLNSAIGQYERICRDVAGRFPDVTVICHGYDYPVPNAGRWLGNPMSERGITDRDLQRRITAVMIDRFNGALAKLARRLRNVRYVDCRGTVPANGWHDELHPRNNAYGAVAAKLLAEVDRVAKPGTRSAPVVAGRAGQGQSLHVGVNFIDEDHYGSPGTLLGCENDAHAMQDIAEKEGFETEVLLSADATRSKVVSTIERAAANLDEGDVFLFTISAHGGKVHDFNNDEAELEHTDAWDESLCLYDFQLIDDELYHLWSLFRPGVRIMFLPDTCHSGSMVRAGIASPALPRSYSAAELAAMTLPERLAALSPQPGMDALHDPQGRVRCLPLNICKQISLRNRDAYRDNAQSLAHVREAEVTAPLATPLSASVLQLGACEDKQFAKDGDQYGAFTAALLNVWDDGRFSGDWSSFHRTILETMDDPSQTPRLRLLEPQDPAYAKQRPLSIFGGPRAV